MCQYIAENWSFLTVCGLAVQVMKLGQGQQETDVTI